MSLTCGEGHVLNQDGAHAWVDGLAQFHELSMVGKGAAKGARIVGPSESRLAAGNDNYRRLAAKAGFSGLALTCEAIEQPKEDNVDLTALMASLTTATEAKATAEVKLAAADGKIATLETQVAELTAKVANDDTGAKLAEAEASLKVATDALTDELKAILTALQKPVENLPTTVAELTAKIAEHRAEFAALIPVGGKSNPAGSGDGEDDKPAPATSAAFSTRR
jgi:phage shock protein A